MLLIIIVETDTFVQDSLMKRKYKITIFIGINVLPYSTYKNPT